MHDGGPGTPAIQHPKQPRADVCDEMRMVILEVRRQHLAAHNALRGRTHVRSVRTPRPSLVTHVTFSLLTHRFVIHPGAVRSRDFKNRSDTSGELRRDGCLSVQCVSKASSTCAHVFIYVFLFHLRRGVCPNSPYTGFLPRAAPRCVNATRAHVSFYCHLLPHTRFVQ